MFSLGLPQWVLAGCLLAIVIGTPVSRFAMMKFGATGFVSWREFWPVWLADLFGKGVLVAILFWGGFWS